MPDRPWSRLSAYLFYIGLPLILWQADVEQVAIFQFARLENGSSVPSLSFLERIADALDATVEIKIKPKPLSP